MSLRPGTPSASLICRRGAQDHAEQVTRLVRVGDHVEFLVKPGCFELSVDVAQRREVLDGETDAVEHGDLFGVTPAGDIAADDLPEFNHRVIIGQLLDLALDTGLRRVFDENVGAKQDVLVQFGLAGAVAADRIDVDTGANHVVGQEWSHTACRR